MVKAIFTVFIFICIFSSAVKAQCETTSDSMIYAAIEKFSLEEDRKICRAVYKTIVEDEKLRILCSYPKINPTYFYHDKSDLGSFILISIHSSSIIFSPYQFLRFYILDRNYNLVSINYTKGDFRHSNIEFQINNFDGDSSDQEILVIGRDSPSNSYFESTDIELFKLREGKLDMIWSETKEFYIYTDNYHGSEVEPCQKITSTIKYAGDTIEVTKTHFLTKCESSEVIDNKQEDYLRNLEVIHELKQEKLIYIWDERLFEFVLSH
jgi:hypothetical protein